MVNKKSKQYSSTRQKTNRGVNMIIDKAEKIGNQGEKIMTNLKDKTIIIKDDIDGYIMKNPEKSVLIATGIGLVIGSILTYKLINRGK